MPTIDVNGITVNYKLEGSPSDELLVLINGLADDLDTWSAQCPDFLAAGYRLLRYDNRGVGGSSRPPGPYTAELLAADLHALLTALLDRHAIRDAPFHLVGVSMGGMIAQAYALHHPNGSSSSSSRRPGGAAGGGRLRLASLALCCTYAAPSAFCARMFALWADMAARMSVADVMRDVTLWAFTVPFFRTRGAELAEVEAALAGLDLRPDEYLAQLNVIRAFDSAGRLEGLRAEERVLGNVERGRVLVLAGKVDILIPVVLSRELADKIEGARFVTCKGGHGCMVSVTFEGTPATDAVTALMTRDGSGSFLKTSTALSLAF